MCSSDLVILQIFGEHQVANALAAATVALAAGVDFATVTQGLRAHTVRSAHRMDVHHAGNDVIVIDDAYNANPFLSRYTRKSKKSISSMHEG